jgi:hypothetical protein
MAGILWLASYPKSGNTWLRAFLANYIHNSSEPVPLNDLPRFVAGDHREFEYEEYLGRKLDGMTPEEILRLRAGFHTWLANWQAHTTLVKTHNACITVDGEPLITPAATAGAVYVARNPLDLAVSFSHHFQVSIEHAVEILCDHRKTLPPSAGNLTVFLGSWSGHVHSWLAAPGMKRHVVRYEDLCRAPTKAFSDLVRFVEQPVDRARIERAIGFSSFGALSKQEKSGGFVEARPDGKARFFRAGKVGVWRKRLTKQQVARLVEVHGPVMHRLGYLTEDLKIAV